MTTVGHPRDILKSHSLKLIAAISSNLPSVTNALYAARLIPQQTKEEMFVPAVDNNTKASKLVNVIEKELKASLDQMKYFHNVCCVLGNQGHQTLTDIANSMLGSNLGECVDSDCLIVYCTGGIFHGVKILQIGQKKV